jgi:DNA-binding GntR family transcriptional regulator
MAKAKAKPDRAKEIYRALRHAIIEQALEPGAKLPEDTIGERFGASRTIVRSALGQLAAEGLVELRRNRGAAVATPAWEDARDTDGARAAPRRVEACRPPTPEQIHALTHVKEEEALGKNRPPIRLCTSFSSARRDDRERGAGALRR